MTAALSPSLSERFVALVNILGRELTLMERLAFKLTEAQLLARADETRFFGAILDEIDAVEEDLGAYGVARAMLVGDIIRVLGLEADDLPLRELIPYAPSIVLDRLAGLLPRLAERVEELDTLRRTGSDVIVARIDDLRQAVDGLEHRRLGGDGRTRRGCAAGPKAAVASFDSGA